MTSAPGTGSERRAGHLPSPRRVDSPSALRRSRIAAAVSALKHGISPVPTGADQVKLDPRPLLGWTPHLLSPRQQTPAREPAAAPPLPTQPSVSNHLHPIKTPKLGTGAPYPGSGAGGGSRMKCSPGAGRRPSGYPPAGTRPGTRRRGPSPRRCPSLCPRSSTRGVAGGEPCTALGEKGRC